MSKWPTLTDRASRIVLNSGQRPTQLDKNFASAVHRAPYYFPRRPVFDFTDNSVVTPYPAPMASVPDLSRFDLKPTFGALYIGILTSIGWACFLPQPMFFVSSPPYLFSWCSWWRGWLMIYRLLGMTTLQTWLYYQRFPKDPILLRFIVSHRYLCPSLSFKMLKTIYRYFLYFLMNHRLRSCGE